MLAPCLDEEDVEEIAKENEDERELSQDITDALHALLEIYGVELLPLILMSDFEWMMSQDAHPVQRCTVLRIFCYIFETCPTDQIQELMGKTLNKFVECMKDGDYDVQQAATYAVGCVAERLKGTFDESMTTLILTNCFANFNESDQVEDSALDAILDNDASVIGKLLRYQPQALTNGDEIYKEWLERCFPIREDTQEAVWCYDYFCELIQTQNKAFLGHNMSNLGRILNCLIDAHGTSLMSENAEKFTRDLIKDLQTNNEALFAQSLSKMDEDKQRKLYNSIGTQI
jgi:hypothetical protein